MAKTAAERVKKHENYRKESGWKKIVVWVPTEADAILIKNLANKLRKEFSESETESHY